MSCLSSAGASRRVQMKIVLGYAYQRLTEDVGPNKDRTVNPSLVREVVVNRGRR
jgi:hypothetical protein